MSGANLVKLELNKYYITEAGYVVYIKDYKNITNSYYTIIEHSPGVTRLGRNILENNKNRTYEAHKSLGWAYGEDGEIHGLGDEWRQKLKIVGELPCNFPEKPPEGWQWAGGFPQFRSVEIGENYMPVDYGGNTYDQVLIFINNYSPPSQKVLGGKRFIVELSESPTQMDNSSIAAKVVPPVESVLERVPNLSFDYEFTANPPEYRFPKSEELFINSNGNPQKAEFDFCNNKYYIVKYKDSKQLIKETAPLFKQPNFIKSGNVKPSANLFAYWVTEPIVNTIIFGKRSFRYVVMLSVISGAGYTAYNPQGVKKSIEKCLPKVNIEFKE